MIKTKIKSKRSKFNTGPQIGDVKAKIQEIHLIIIHLCVRRYFCGHNSFHYHLPYG